MEIVADVVVVVVELILKPFQLESHLWNFMSCTDEMFYGRIMSGWKKRREKNEDDFMVLWNETREWVENKLFLAVSYVIVVVAAILCGDDVDAFLNSIQFSSLPPHPFFTLSLYLIFPWNLDDSFVCLLLLNTWKWLRVLLFKSSFHSIFFHNILTFYFTLNLRNDDTRKWREVRGGGSGKSKRFTSKKMMHILLENVGKV